MDKNGFKAFHFGENIEEDVLADYHYQAAALAQKLRPGTENCSCDMFTVDLYDRETGNKLSFALGTCNGKIAMKSCSGKVYIVCDQQD